MNNCSSHLTHREVQKSEGVRLDGHLSCWISEGGDGINQCCGHVQPIPRPTVLPRQKAAKQSVAIISRY